LDNVYLVVDVEIRLLEKNLWKKLLKNLVFVLVLVKLAVP
jgi:hypothetical protein